MPVVPEWSGADRYTLLRRIGRGGVGEVFLARNPEGKSVAVKMLAERSGRNPRTRTRFARELEVARQLDDPGVVEVFDGALDEGTAWFAMQWVSGPALDRVLVEGPVPVEEALRLGHELAQTLSRLHRRGFAHRDVKPSNILVTPTGAPLLADFGLVGLIEQEARERITTHAVGTPAYMAPEQVREPLAAHDGTALDQFALALVVEELCTGRLPDPSALGDSLVSARHPALGKVLSKAHHPDPFARYASLEAFAADLQRARLGQPVSARPPGVLYGVQRVARAWRARVGFAVVAVLVLGIIGVVGMTGREWLAERAAAERAAAMEDRLTSLRAEGRDEEADAVFEAFVALPENQGRDALAHAWLRRGQRDLEQPTFTQAIDDLSRAFVAATTPETRAETAAVLDVALRQAGRFVSAYKLRRAYAAAVEPADDVALMLEAGDAEAVLAQLPPDDRRRQVVERFRRATELPRRVKLTGDLDGDGADELFFDGSHPLAMPTEGLPVRAMMEDRVLPVFGAPYWLDATADGGLVEPAEEGGFQSRCAFDARGYLPGALHGDELYLLEQGQQRRITRLDVRTCERDQPFPSIDAMGSYPLAIDIADLDGDGEAEAVIAVGPSEGHGVWVLKRRGGTWEERAHLRLGYVAVVRVVDTAHGPRVVATAVAFGANPRFFPEPPHLGVPAGQHILEFTGEELRVVDALLARQIVDTRERHWVTTWFGHVDDDGYQDIVTNRGYAFLSTSDPDRPFERVPTGFDTLDFIVDIDDDGLVEFGATVEGRTLMFGVGESVPPRSFSDQLALTGDPALDGARSLEHIGLEAFAAEAYARIGRGRQDAGGTEALVRAAEMLAESDPGAAAAAAEEAASRGRVELVPQAVDRYIETLDFESANRVLGEHGSTMDPAVAAALREDVAAVRNEFVVTVPPTGARWNERVTWEPGTFEVRPVMGAGSLLTLPLRQTGEVVGMKATLWTDQMEFGSQLAVRLSNQTGQTLSFKIAQLERGGTHYRYAGGKGWGKEVEVAGTRSPTRFDVVMQEMPNRPWVTVEVRLDGELLQRSQVPRNRGDTPEWLFELTAPAIAGLHGHMGTVQIERLTFVGLEPDGRQGPVRWMSEEAPYEAMVGDPNGRALLHGRLRQDPLLLDELVRDVGPAEAYGLVAEALGKMPEGADRMLPVLAALDPEEVARISPPLVVIRSALLCRVGRENDAVTGLLTLEAADRCAAARRFGSCFEDIREGCSLR